jgi:hypothetical protein
LDCSIKERFCQRVEHILADVDGFITGEFGIDYLKSSAGDIKADMFVDCTGFKAGLIGQYSKYIDFSPKLWVDKCIPVRLPYKDKNKQLTDFDMYYEINAFENWVQYN